MAQIKTLPALKDLHHDPDLAYKNDQLKLLLHQSPPALWVKENKQADNAEYLPIDKVEYLLDRIYQEWKIEVLSVAQLFSAVCVTVRLHYKNPQNGEWSFHDGVGAKELQTKKGTGPVKADLSNVNFGAVTMATPIAKATAIKDAADHLGRLFGRDLNRKDTISDFSGAYSQTEERAKKDPPVPLPPAGENYNL